MVEKRHILVCGFILKIKKGVLAVSWDETVLPCRFNHFHNRVPSWILGENFPFFFFAAPLFTHHLFSLWYAEVNLRYIFWRENSTNCQFLVETFRKISRRIFLFLFILACTFEQVKWSVRLYLRIEWQVSCIGI